MLNKRVKAMFMNTIKVENYGKETTKRKPSKEFEEVSKR